MSSAELSESEASARGRSVAIVAARFNDLIVSSLLKGARAAWLARGGASDGLLVARVPGAFELPPIKIGHLHHPATATEYGMKGMGEGGAVAPPAAIANAVRDALASLGAEVNETPLTSERVLAAIRRARAQMGVR